MTRQQVHTPALVHTPLPRAARRRGGRRGSAFGRLRAALAACLMDELSRDQPEKDAGQPFTAAVRPQEPDGRRKDVRRVKPLPELRPNVFPLGGTVQVCTLRATEAGAPAQPALKPAPLLGTSRKEEAGVFTLLFKRLRTLLTLQLPHRASRKNLLKLR